MDIQLSRRLFTAEEYHRMDHAGIFSEDDRVELLEGEIVEMTPIGSRHAACVARLTALFSRVQQKCIVWVQNPIRIEEHSEPQPDLALLKPRPDFYAQEHPGPHDVLLLVEVAETSADYDRTTKIPLYARAGITEVWLVDIQKGIVEVYLKPTSEGFRENLRIQHGQSLSPKALLADLVLTVDQIFV